MKPLPKFILLIASIAFFTTTSCKKDCDNTIPICSETAPTNELCTAYFTRWFYDKKSNSCKEIGYSGCSQKGFSTKQECEECKCK